MHTFVPNKWNLRKVLIVVETQNKIHINYSQTELSTELLLFLL